MRTVDQVLQECSQRIRAAIGDAAIELHRIDPKSNQENELLALMDSVALSVFRAIPDRRRREAMFETFIASVSEGITAP